MRSHFSSPRSAISAAIMSGVRRFPHPAVAIVVGMDGGIPLVTCERTVDNISFPAGGTTLGSAEDQELGTSGFDEKAPLLDRCGTPVACASGGCVPRTRPSPRRGVADPVARLVPRGCTRSWLGRGHWGTAVSGLSK